MRTTVNLDDDVLGAARAIARAEGRALGEVLSGLARRGLVPARPRLSDRPGFPVFEVEPSVATITERMVKTALAEPWPIL